MTTCVFVSSSGENIPVVINSRHGLRNITLRPKTRPVREIHISKPLLVSTKSALDFMESKRRWIESVFANSPDKVKIVPGDVLEILGRRVVLVHDVMCHANVLQTKNNDEYVLTVGGAPEMFEHRVRDFVKAEFLKSVKQIIKTTPREFWPCRITIRDTTSRWGSCSSTGTMSFCWRLAFAPVEVMRYVVMHELAHTQHMNHSPDFWKQVSELYGFGVGRARRWLATNGSDLHRYF